MAQSFLSHSVGETFRLGSEFAKKLHPGDVVALYGELGSGKTHFIKGACQGLGVAEHVASPTFTIINEYETPSVRVCHFDFYRLKDLAELREIGFDEYFAENICLIEWADRVKELLPPQRFDISLNFGPDENSRAITIEALEVS